ncbi:hypothetical protein LINPERPRIM_LOCUS443 [Linum perenne]
MSKARGRRPQWLPTPKTAIGWTDRSRGGMMWLTLRTLSSRSRGFIGRKMSEVDDESK